MPKTKKTRKTRKMKKVSTKRASLATLAEESAQRTKLERMDPQRRKIMGILASGEANVAQLSARLRLAQPSVSYHLAVLRHLKFIEARREGKHNSYSLTKKGVAIVPIVIEAAPPSRKSPKTGSAKSQSGLVAVRDRLTGLVAEPDTWLRTPNPRFEGRKPAELFNTPEWRRVELILDAAEEGFFS
jgi:DNA-binding transcriptional ArsR family regulator